MTNPQTPKTEDRDALIWSLRCAGAKYPEIARKVGISASRARHICNRRAAQEKTEMEHLNISNHVHHDPSKPMPEGADMTVRAMMNASGHNEADSRLIVAELRKAGWVLVKPTWAAAPNAAPSREAPEGYSIS